MDRTAVIITGATGPIDAPGPNDLVIAADGGLTRAYRSGTRVDLVVGDLDSADPEDVSHAEAAGVAIERHPVAKDATDLELALEAASARGATHIRVMAGPGDRFDHLVGELSLLASPAWSRMTVGARYGPAQLDVLHGPAQTKFDGAPGSTISLVPVHGSAVGITTDGLRFPLNNETLPAGTSRGMSNELIGSHGHIELLSGTLLIVRPHHHGNPS